jgi:hypothetical protein
VNRIEHCKLQSEILDKAFTILQGDRRDLGIVMAGSYARNKHVAFLDLDLGCHIRDENLTGREALCERVAEISALLSKLVIFDLNALCLLENGVRLELIFIAHWTLRMIWKFTPMLKLFKIQMSCWHDRYPSLEVPKKRNIHSSLSPAIQP